MLGEVGYTVVGRRDIEGWPIAKNANVCDTELCGYSGPLERDGLDPGGVGVEPVGAGVPAATWGQICDFDLLISILLSSSPLGPSFASRAWQFSPHAASQLERVRYSVVLVLRCPFVPAALSHRFYVPKFSAVVTFYWLDTLGTTFFSLRF